MHKNLNSRILGKNIFVSNDCRKTGLNNNDLIVGVSGSGKTGGYVIPNIELANESMIIADTKGNLHRKYAQKLKDAGYVVHLLDFVNLDRSESYNPLDYIKAGKTEDSCREQDIITIARAMVPNKTKNDPFWDESARTVVASLISFVKEALPEEEQNLESALKIFKLLGTAEGSQLFREFEAEKPDSFAIKKYHQYEKSFAADRTWACICQFVTEALELYDLAEANTLFRQKSSFRFEELGERKTAVFINISDTDRAFDKLVNVFYTQALHELCTAADKNENGCLDIPVRIILDDFATNVYIPDFDKIISVIRSRGISVSIILQSISQLETLYTKPQAQTIINGCDHMLYLGSQDVDTAHFVAIKANKTTDNILNMKLDDAYLFSRGELPRKIEKVPPYQFNPDAVL